MRSIWRYMLAASFPSSLSLHVSPALPDLASYYRLSDGEAQWLLLGYLLPLALGQLLYPPLADRFGRKAAFFTGCALCFAGILLSLLAIGLDSYALLVLSRMLTALGGCAGLVISVILIFESYPPENHQRVMACVMVSFAFIPYLFTLLTGIVVEVFAWQVAFFLPLPYLALVTWAYRPLPETLSSLQTDALKPAVLLRKYATGFSRGSLVLLSLSAGFAASCLYLLSGQAPLLLNVS